MKTWLLLAVIVIGFLVVAHVGQIIGDYFISRTTQWALLASAVIYMAVNR
jgi:uncharacterized protein YneF (UPF0154 family)